jgi:hypothetical protein
MTAPRRPRALSQRSVDAEVGREVERIQRERIHMTQIPEQRCRICRDPEARRRVNEMLARGMLPGDIVENVADINARRKKNATISYHVVRNHRVQHFNIQEPVKAAQLRQLEQYAAQKDAELFAEGVGTILTAKGYLRIIAEKGFTKLIQEDTEVGFTTGLDAQIKLEELEKADKGDVERAAIRRDVALIQQAIVETLTEEQMRAVSHRLNILRGVTSEEDSDEVIEADFDDEDDYGNDDEVADPGNTHDDEDELDPN